ncbi:hypothetical protein LTS10_011452 [Elasticomyces elasticus]|nr:hypothetical protein LTS10_011452 [Elasticomyces elasticus]
MSSVHGVLTEGAHPVPDVIAEVAESMAACKPCQSATWSCMQYEQLGQLRHRASKFDLHRKSRNMRDAIRLPSAWDFIHAESDYEVDELWEEWEEEEKHASEVREEDGDVLNVDLFSLTSI